MTKDQSIHLEQLTKVTKELAFELQESQICTKVDWHKIISLIIEMLPIIFAFFQTPDPTPVKK